MCYSAQIKADYAKLVRHYGATMSLEDFARLYTFDPDKKKPRTSKAMDDGFNGARTERGRDIVTMIQQWHAQEQAELEQELRQQCERRDLASANLAQRPTQKARNALRVASNRITKAQTRLDDLVRQQLLPRDERLFPGSYAPVIVSEGGKRVIKPMRYQCRLPGKPASNDTLYPGTYNARRDNLEGYWRGAFGHRHGVIAVTSFYEHVEGPPPASPDAGAANHAGGHRVLEFSPAPPRELLLACVWAHWEDEDTQLLSFAAITDTPPRDVAAAGHDRGVIPIRPEHLDAWLNPDPGDLAAQYRILDDREDITYTWREAS